MWHLQLKAILTNSKLHVLCNIVLCADYYVVLLLKLRLKETTQQLFENPNVETLTGHILKPSNTAQYVRKHRSVSSLRTPLWVNDSSTRTRIPWEAVYNADRPPGPTPWNLLHHALAHGKLLFVNGCLFSLKLYFKFLITKVIRIHGGKQISF